MYKDDTTSRFKENWINILEDHFREKNKAFLVFDRENTLQHVSQYAMDILGVTANQIGVLSVYDLFPQAKQNPNFIPDHNSRYMNVNDFTYTTPSGKPIDVRFNLDKKPGMSGYIVWIEPRMRDTTGTFRRISSFDLYKDLKPIFDSSGLGFMIIDRNGMIIDHNKTIKYVLRLPGKWKGRNIFTFPPLQKIRFEEFIYQSINKQPAGDSKVVKIQYSSKAEPVKIHMSVSRISDTSGSAAGALISCRIKDN